MATKKDDKVGALVIGAILVFFAGRCSVSQPAAAPVSAPALVVSEHNSHSIGTDTVTTDELVAESASEPLSPISPQRLADTQADLGGTEDDEGCGFKTVCRQMDSCAEAQHYLNDCGLTRLDGDHDGVACESLC